MQRVDWINLVFCIDASGSMFASKEDVVGGYLKTVEEQKSNKNGKVTVSLYTFNSEVKEYYVGLDINDIPDFKYECDGMTRMNDGIGIAIDNVGKWLYERDKKGEDMPGLTMFILMTDGMENFSKEYTLAQVQDKIKEQTEKYSWKFIYQGTDITTTKESDSLGFKFKTFSSRSKFANNYNIINCATNAYRSMAATGASLADTTLAFAATLDEEATKNTAEYEKDLGIKLSST